MIGSGQTGGKIRKVPYVRRVVWTQVLTLDCRSPD